MSNALAIAAVTETLRILLDRRLNNPLPDGIDHVTVTVKPLDKARDAAAPHQLNLFLYHTAVDPAFRNSPYPGDAKQGESGPPPLPLVLSYLITAYGQGDEDRFGHRILGQAMSILHDHPLLGRDDIKTALPASELHRQPERVRLTPQVLSLEEMSKLWTTFQTQYRVSAAYQAAVVLIESRQPSRTPLPVLARGEADRGATAAADTTSPFPRLDAATFPNAPFGARLGDEVTLTGQNLDAATVRVLVAHPLLPQPLEIPPPPLVATSATQIRFLLPDDPDLLPAGLATVSAAIGRTGEPERTTNALPLPIAPAITGTLPIEVVAVAGAIVIPISCRPNVLPDQRAMLLFGDRQLPADAHPVKTGALTFRAGEVAPGEYRSRLRIDGVDSPLVDATGPKPIFDERQKVIVA